MLSAVAVRRQIESELEQRIPGALTPRPRTIREVAATGVPELDSLLQGGLPIGAITELVGPPCSGRTTLALASLAELTSAGKAVAWVDASDSLDPESAAAAGVDLSRQLWVRCGNPTTPTRTATQAHITDLTSALPGPPLLAEPNRVPAAAGSCNSSHPRTEARGLSQAIDAFMQPDTFARAIPPRGPDPNRPNPRKDRMAGTPGAPNRKLSNAPSQGNAFPNRAADRQEQTPTDRLPSRRGANATPSQRQPKNISAAQIAYTNQVAGSWDDNRNNANGRALKTSPNAIAAGLPRFQEMEARAAGQGHGIDRGPFHWKPSLTHLQTPQHNTASLTARMPQVPILGPGSEPTKNAPPPASLAGEPPSRFKTSPIWKALDQALRSTDLLLAAGGFSAVVLDLGSIPPEFAWRIPLATWFRFRAAAERARTVLLVLTQHPCARSSAELVLRLSPAEPQATATVLTGAGFQIAIDRRRFETSPSPTTEPHAPQLHLVTLRKPPQPERATTWHRPAAWARGAQ